MEENEDDDGSDEEETFADNDGFSKLVGKNELNPTNATAQGKNGIVSPPSEPIPKPKLPDSLSMLAMPLPLVAAGHSLLPDMQFGWKPQADKDIPPIPFCFGLVYYNLEQFNYPKVLYVGPRFSNSYKMHE